MISLMLTMNTKAQTLTSLWLLLVLIGLLNQGIHAGLMQQHKQGKPKNLTVTVKDRIPVTSKPKHVNKLQTITTTTTTTAKPKENSSLTTNSPEFDLDGRHAYINNQFVSDQEPIHSNSPALYQMLQQQMENILSPTGLKREISMENNPQAKEMITENTNAKPAKPLFSYNMNNFNDYDEDTENEEELSEQEEQQTENCEDTEESLSEDDYSTTYGNAGPTNQHNNYSKTQEQTPQTSAQNSSNQQKLQQPNKLSKGSNDSSTYNSSTYNSSQYKKPSTSHNHQNTALPHTQISYPQASSNHSHIAYPQTSPNQQTYKPSQPHEKTKPSHSKKSSSQLSPTGLQQGPSNNHHKSQSKRKSSKYPSSISQNNPSHSKQQVVNKPREPSKNPNKYKHSNIDGNSNTKPVSPFSTPTSSGGNSGKTPSRRRHLAFRTVSSSTQFVSTPLADFILKFSIGLAKPAKAGVESNQGQINDSNNKEMIY